MNINWEFVQQMALVVMFIAYVRSLFKLRRYRKSEAAREALIKRLDESEPPKVAPPPKRYRFKPTPDISPAEVAYFIQHHFAWDNASTPYYRDIVTAIEQATSAVKAYWVETSVEQSKCKRQFEKI